MTSSISVVCGFLGGTILSVEGGYRVLQHPRPERVFNRIADARWFLAITWCDQCPLPSAILTHDGHFSFQNQTALELGESEFLPLEQRQGIFDSCLSLRSGETIIYTVQKPGDRCNQQVQVQGVEIDPRYGKVAIVQAVEMDSLATRPSFEQS